MTDMSTEELLRGRGQVLRELQGILRRAWLYGVSYKEIIEMMRVHWKMEDKS